MVCHPLLLPTKKAEAGRQDVHVAIVERNYGNVPGSWYAAVGVPMFLASVFVVVAYPLQVRFALSKTGLPGC